MGHDAADIRCEVERDEAERAVERRRGECERGAFGEELVWWCGEAVEGYGKVMAGECRLCFLVLLAFEDSLGVGTFRHGG